MFYLPEVRGSVCSSSHFVHCFSQNELYCLFTVVQPLIVEYLCNLWTLPHQLYAAISTFSAKLSQVVTNCT